MNFFIKIGVDENNNMHIFKEQQVASGKQANRNSVLQLVENVTSILDVFFLDFE